MKKQSTFETAESWVLLGTLACLSVSVFVLTIMAVFGMGLEFGWWAK